jgi:hypothetical protein
MSPLPELKKIKAVLQSVVGEISGFFKILKKKLSEIFLIFSG